MISLDKSIHIGIFGTTGAGKDVLGEQILELDYINEGMKIVDLQNNKYIEGLGFLRKTRLRNLEKPMLREWASKKGVQFNNFNGFPTEIHHPIIDSTLGFPRRLPECIKLYTIPMEFFTHENVLKILTNDSLTDSSYVTLTEEIKKMSKSDSMPNIPIRILETTDRKIMKTTGAGNVPFIFFTDTKKSSTGANRPILKMRELGIFTSQNCEYVLTDKKIKEILLDKKNITVFTTRFIPEKFRKLKLSINYWLFHKIREIGQKIGGGVSVYIREAREIFPHPRTIDRGLKVLSDQAEDVIKDCRKAGIRIRLSTQSPLDIPEGVLGELSTRFLFRHNLKEGTLLEMYNGSAGIDVERIKNLRKLALFHYYFTGFGARLQDNPIEGNTVQFRFTDHLLEREDELLYVKDIYPREEWYETKHAFESLRQDWLQSYDKTKKKVERLYETHEEFLKAKSIGFTSLNDKRTLEYLYNQIMKGIKFVRFIDMVNGIPMKNSTLADSLTRLSTRGFITQNEDKEYTLSQGAITFIENNLDVFILTNDKNKIGSPITDGEAIVESI